MSRSTQGHPLYVGTVASSSEQDLRFFHMWE